MKNDKMLKKFQSDFTRWIEKHYRTQPVDHWAALPESEKERIRFQLMTKQIPKL